MPLRHSPDPRRVEAMVEWAQIAIGEVEGRPRPCDQVGVADSRPARKNADDGLPLPTSPGGFDRAG